MATRWQPIVCMVLFAAVAYGQHPSPCPELFAYGQVQAEKGTWEGELTLDSEFLLQGVWIRVIFDRKLEQLKSTFGEVEERESNEYLIRDREYFLHPGKPLHLPIAVKYTPGEPIPSFVGLRLNGRTVCPAKPVVGISKCPGIFSYNQEKVEDNKWYGTLLIDSEYELKGLWIRVELDQSAELLVNEFGEVTTTDNISYLIRNPNVTQVPGRPLRIPFSVKYAPVNKIPAIHAIRLNGRTICGQQHLNAPTQRFPVRSEIPPEPSTTTTLVPDVTPTTPEQDTSQNPYISCGTVVPESVNLIVNGERARSAQWPWHGALYLTKKRNLDYICGMSLISESHAITAAHCLVENIKTKEPRDPKSLVLYFGLLNRKDFTASHVQRAQAHEVIVHPNYTISENDIGVIRFRKPVKFTDWVRPVCLWQGDVDMRYIVNGTGTVVGFGVTETGAVSNELLFADILIVDTPTCIFSRRDFYSKYTSPNTYCAGNLTQSAVCNGDSGGGMVLKRDGTDIWQIRGIVSTAVRNKETGLCDYNFYAIFTDVAKYVDWIEAAIAS